jgi:hypothetical protein
MLATNDRENTLWLNPNRQLIHTHLSGNNKATYNPQHLYITSDDEIKDGDWYINNIIPHTIRVEQSKGANSKSFYDSKDVRKIIATTDTSLKIITGIVGSGTGVPLPSPSESFIKAYIESYNNGNVIEDVLVEVETIHADRAPNGWETLLKLKDNNIIIKKVKDSWSREEVKTLLLRYQNRLSYAHRDVWGYVTKEWIDENL